MIVLGIDPGLTGGLALIESGERRRVVYAGDIPTFGVDAKRRVDGPKVLALLQKHKIAHAFIERAQAMPGDGGSSAFIYGRAVGALETCVMGMMIPTTFVEASVWKREQGLTRPPAIDDKQWRKVVKEMSRARASLLYPGCPFWPLVQDHGRAEAALIAHHGLDRLQSPLSSTKKKTRSVPVRSLDDPPRLI